jgi:biopolymer transport protein ExbD
MSERRRPRPEVDDGVALTLTSLLDVTAIVLICVLRSLVSTPLALPQVGIALPRAAAGQPVSDATTIAITADHLIVNDRAVARIAHGQLAASAKRDGSDGYFITPLHAALVEAAAAARRIDPRFDGTVVIVADRDVPFRLLSEVLYTAGQAEFGRFEFAVVAGR